MEIKMQRVDAKHGQEINEVWQMFKLIESCSVGIMAHISSSKLSNYHVNYKHYNFLKSVNWCIFTALCFVNIPRLL